MWMESINLTSILHQSYINLASILHQSNITLVEYMIFLIHQVYCILKATLITFYSNWYVDILQLIS